jgi:predicted small lipoprotein YifL
MSKSTILVAAAILFSILAACGNIVPSVDCAPTAEDNACYYTDTDLRSCLSLTSGIYGVTDLLAICTTSNCGGKGPRPPSCSNGVRLSARAVGGGPWIEATSTYGIYSLALDPGDYEVCPDAMDCPRERCSCALVTISAGQLVRVNRRDEFGAFGKIRDVKRVD